MAVAIVMVHRLRLWVRMLRLSRAATLNQLADLEMLESIVIKTAVSGSEPAPHNQARRSDPMLTESNWRTSPNVCVRRTSRALMGL